jgi:hypothetical protein
MGFAALNLSFELSFPHPESLTEKWVSDLSGCDSIGFAKIRRRSRCPGLKSLGSNIGGTNCVMQAI